MKNKIYQSWKKIKELDYFAGGMVLFVLTSVTVIIWMWCEDKLPHLLIPFVSFGVATIMMVIWLVVMGMVSGKRKD